MSADELAPDLPGELLEEDVAEERPRHELAEAWADFTKALSIYPETNVRVRENLAQILDAHARSLESSGNALSPRSEGVAVLFRSGQLVLDGEETEIPDGSSLAWLEARLDRASLAGLEFMASLDEEALLAFTKQLLSIYLRRDGPTDFDALWPDRYDGLVMIDRRFEGRFGVSADELEYSGGHASTGAAEDDKRNLVEVLLESEDVTAPLARLEALSDEEAEGTTYSAADLMNRIIKLMPADAMKDRETLVAAVRDVLSALEERVDAEQQQDTLSEITNDMTLSTLLYSVSRSHFTRTGPEETDWAVDDAIPEAAPAKRKVGHAGDEKIDEDIDAFLEEWAALPEECSIDLSLSHAEVQGEEAAVLLHYLVRTGDTVRLEGLYPTLDKVLKKPGDEVLAVLRAYLQDRAQKKDDARVTIGARTPVLDFLRRTNRTNLLRASGVFKIDWVVKAFPQYFTLYLDSLNPRRSQDIEELNIVCRRIGNDRMLRAMGPLLAEGGQLSKDTARDLLLQPDPDRVALARLLVEWHGASIAQALAAFLRKIDLDQPEAFLVRRIHDARYFTIDYLRGLLDLHLGRTKGSRLHNAISDVLCRHIRGTKDAEPRSPTRMASIESLIDYPSANSWFMLQELTQFNLFKLRSLEPAAVRRLARSMRKQYKAA